MSQVPEPLRWAALITGTQLPEADPALLRQQGEVWGDLARQVQGMMSEVNSVRSTVLANVNGQPAESFDNYMRTLGTTLPELVKAADNLRLRSDEYALETEHATAMTEAMLAWMLVELAFLANTLFGLAAVPALITGVRQVIQAILRRLFMSAAIGAASMTGLETLLQGIEILKGTRKHLDPNAIKNMALGGAIGGAVFGAFSGIASHFAPKFANSLVGRTAIGAGAGVIGGVAVNAALGAEQDLGLAALAGAAGAMLAAPGMGGGRRQEVTPTEGLADAVKSLSSKGPLNLPEGVNSTELSPLGGAGGPGGTKDLMTADPGSGTGTPGAVRETVTPGPDTGAGGPGAVRTAAPSPGTGEHVSGRPSAGSSSSTSETTAQPPGTAVPAPATAVPAGAGTARGAGAETPGAAGDGVARTGRPETPGGATEPTVTAAAPPTAREATPLPGFEGGSSPVAGGTGTRAGLADPAAPEQVREVVGRDRTPSPAVPTESRTTVPPVAGNGRTTGGEAAGARGTEVSADAGVARPGSAAPVGGSAAPGRGAEAGPDAAGAGRTGELPGRTVVGGPAEVRGAVGETGATGGGSASGPRPGVSGAVTANAGRPEGVARGADTPATTAGETPPARPTVTVQPGRATTSGEVGGPAVGAPGAPGARME
ncbi:hypothetical protein ACFY71_27825, partial [Streptomyces cinerochromogenes]